MTSTFPLRNNYSFKKAEGTMKRKHRKSKPVIIDRHHITPRCLGGSGEIDNLLLIKRVKHIALHCWFNHLNLREIYEVLSKVNLNDVFNDNRFGYWITLFKDKTKEEALAFLERVIRAKEAQKKQ